MANKASKPARQQTESQASSRSDLPFIKNMTREEIERYSTVELMELIIEREWARYERMRLRKLAAEELTYRNGRQPRIRRVPLPASLRYYGCPQRGLPAYTS